MVGMPLTDLTPTEQSILDFERAWWQSPGPKGDAIRTQLQMSPSAYYRRLDAVIQAVADQMQQGFEQRFYHGLVGAGARSLDREIYRLGDRFLLVAASQEEGQTQ